MFATLILRLRDEQRAVLLSTHNLDEVERIADRVAVLRTRLVALDTPAALRTKLFGSRVLVRLGDTAARFAASFGPAFTDVRADDTDAVDCCRRCGAGDARNRARAGPGVERTSFR